MQTGLDVRMRWSSSLEEMRFVVCSQSAAVPAPQQLRVMSYAIMKVNGLYCFEKSDYYFILRF